MASEVLSKLEEHMEVVCCNGSHVGTFDCLQGDELKLTKNDSEDGMHHLIPSSLVASVDTRVHLSKSCDEVKSMWKAI